MITKLIARLIFAVYSEFEDLWDEKHKNDCLSYSVTSPEAYKPVPEGYTGKTWTYSDNHSVGSVDSTKRTT